MTINKRLGLSASFLALAIALPALGHEFPLSPTAIREAYFLGTRVDSKTAEFFEQYVHKLPPPKTGPHVAAVSILTPYAQVVEHAGRTINYSAQDAVKDFLGKPAVFRLRVDIHLTATYSEQLASEAGTVRFRSPDFWRDFQIKLIQNKEEISVQAVQGHSVHGFKGRGLIGAFVELEFKSEKVDSAPISVQVLTPDGQQVVTTFDLTRLR